MQGAVVLQLARGLLEAQREERAVGVVDLAVEALVVVSGEPVGAAEPAAESGDASEVAGDGDEGETP